MHRIILNSNGEIVGKVRLNKCYLSRHQNSSFEFHHLVIASFLFSLIFILFFKFGIEIYFAKYTRAAFALNSEIANKSIFNRHYSI
jgi:membrane-bound metal-dependent hydrolase YbcI (DUF457 family)